jgi:serine/threonine-protein kinase RsbW
MSEVTVTAPARPEFVHVLRSVVATVAARADLTYDEIDDLRLAVDEACAQLLALPAGATTLALKLTAMEEGGLVVVVTTDADHPAWPPEGAERTLTWQVLAALADEARFEEVDGHPALRLTKRRQPAPAH